MAAPPTIVSAIADKQTYVRGETITVTIGYQPGQADATITVFCSIKGSASGPGPMFPPLTFEGTAQDLAMVSVTSDPQLDWQPVSDDGNTAVFEAVYQ